MPDANEMTSALAGIRVVDLTRGMAGPMVGMTLADHGADVVKIEPVGGDYGRAWAGFDLWNRGKTTLELDLSTDDGTASLRTLIDAADVVIDDARPGSWLRDELEEIAEQAGVVHCQLSAFGPAGDGESPPGYEAVVSAAAGLYLGLDEVSGAAPATPRNRPIFTVAPTNSFAAAHLAAQAILAALLANARGQHVRQVETSLLQGALATLMRRRFARIDAAGGGKPAPGRTRTVQRGIALTFLTVQCADGRWLQMCARQDAHFLAWLNAIGLDDAAEDPRYANGPMTIPTVEDIDEIQNRIRERMKTKPASHWLDVLTGAGVGVDEFLTPAEFLAHDVTRDNGLVTTWADDDEPTLAAMPTLSATPAGPPRRLTSGAPKWDGPPTGRRTAAPTLTVQDSAAHQVGRREGPLSGVTVLEVAYFIAAPLATTFLAELGARVIKVEPITGDPYRRTGVEVAHLLHGKESIALDLKSPDGIAVLHRLIGSADALLQSFRPGVAERLGFGYDKCRQLNDQLVYVFSTGYGTRGRMVGKPAFHSTPNAWSGGGLLQAGAGNPPVDCSYPDPASAIVNATSLLLGLTARDRTGQGQYIETCMLAAGAHVMSNWYTPAGVRSFETQDQQQRGHGANYRLYECVDGWVFLAAPTRVAWNALTKALGRSGWTAEPIVGATWESLRAFVQQFEAELEAFFAIRAVEEVTDELSSPSFAVVHADGHTLEEYLEGLSLLAPASHPDYGDYWKMPSKFAINGSRPTLGEAPRCGEHTVQIMREVGFDDDTIRTMMDNGVVGAAGEPTPVGTGPGSVVTI